jgi:hypothetical protein
MPATILLRRLAPLLLTALLGLAACSPQHDWRETRDADASFSILMPAKPAVVTRPVSIDGKEYSMTMTAADVQQVTFAVGVVRVPDAAQAAAVMTVMKDTLLKNIGSVRANEKIVTSAEGGSINIRVDTLGKSGGGQRGEPRALHARFVAKGATVYQAIVAGPENAITDESVETFLTSFKAL